MKSNKFLFYLCIAAIGGMAIYVVIQFVIPYFHKSSPSSKTEVCITKDIPELSNQECERLALCIPNHKMEEYARNSFSEEYLKAWDMAISMPSKNFYYYGYIDDNEWLYYFVTGNGDAGEISVQITDKRINANTACVELNYLFDGIKTDNSHHIMSLSFNENKWVICNYDSTLQQMKKYVASGINEYLSDSTNTDAQEIQDDDAVMRYRKDMDEFLQRF